MKISWLFVEPSQIMLRSLLPLAYYSGMRMGGSFSLEWNQVTCGWQAISQGSGYED